MSGVANGLHNRIQDLDLWECVNAISLVNTDAATRDVIGCKEARGFTIYESQECHKAPVTPKSNKDGGGFEVKVEDLDKSNIEAWVERNSIEASNLDNRLRLKVLVLEQVIRGDKLRPPTDAGAITLSRSHVQKHFGSPPMALEKISRNEAWAWEFPTSQTESLTLTSCAGLGNLDFNLVWMTKEKSNTTWAIAMFARPVTEARTNFELELTRLRRFCNLPAFLPFIAVTSGMLAVERRMENHLRSIFETDVGLGRFPNGQVASRLYMESTGNASGIAGELRSTKAMKRALELCSNQNHSLPSQTSSGIIDRGAEFSSAMSYQKQALQTIIEDCQETQAQIARQIECILGFMAQAQATLSIQIAENQSKLAEASKNEQSISVEIARSSQEIAAETRRDGSSMKTLAVVTLVYLPCTTISSILAMPLFDWDAENGAVINPRIWVYFVLAVPLTLITIVIWQLWLRHRARQRPQANGAGVRRQGQSTTTSTPSP